MAGTGVSPISLFMPGMAETQVGLSNIERQRKIAELMQQQSMQPLESPPNTAQGWAVKTSPFSAAAKMLQGYSAGRINSTLDARQLALIKGLAGQYSGMFGSSQPLPVDQSAAVQGALSNGAGPTPENAATLSKLIQPAQARQGSLQMPGVDSGTAQARFVASPEKYMEALFKDQERSPVDKIAANLGIQKGTPEYKDILVKELTKATHTPLDIVRQNSIALDPSGSVKSYNPPPIPGAFTQFQGGMPTGYTQAPGAQAIMAGNAAATSGGQAAGKAPYETQTLNTEGAPTMMTQEQAIQAATGKPMPQPGPQLPQGVPASDAAAFNYVAGKDRRGQPASANMQGPGGALQTNVPIPNGPPGLRLQDQGAGANQRSFGTERGQLEAAAPQAAIQARTAIANIERLKNVASELENHPGLSGITGKINQYSVFDVVPQTRAARGLQQTLVKQSAVSTLESMRAASKSGGAVGQVTEKEWPILEQQLAALDAAQGTDDYKVALKNLQNQMDGSLERVKAAYQETYKEPLQYKSIPYQSQSHGIQKISSDAEHAALRTGTVYIDPTGKKRIKR